MRIKHTEAAYIVEIKDNPSHFFARNERGLQSSLTVSIIQGQFDGVIVLYKVDRCMTAISKPHQSEV
jgi:hypothetical protein